MHNQRAGADAVTTCREPAPCATNEGARGWRRRFHSGAYATRDMFGLSEKGREMFINGKTLGRRGTRTTVPRHLASILRGHRALKARPVIVRELPIMNYNGV